MDNNLDRFNHLLNVISHDRFLSMQGIGNEVPFFICPFNPKETLDMESIEKNLLKNLKQKNISVLNINLYDTVIEMMSKEGDWDYYNQNESKLSKKDLLDELRSLLDVEDYLVPYIEEKMNLASFQVMFISGIGQVFPYIRAHKLLNNLQKSAKNHPTLMFFPGEYSHSAAGGASLNLFNKFSTDHYYRAFNIYDFQV